MDCSGRDWALADLSSISSSVWPVWLLCPLAIASFFYCLPRMSSLFHFPILLLTGQFLLVFQNWCFKKLFWKHCSLLSTSIFPLSFHCTWVGDSLMLPVSVYLDWFIYIIHPFFGTRLKLLRLGTVWLKVLWYVGEMFKLCVLMAKKDDRFAGSLGFLTKKDLVLLPRR